MRTPAFAAVADRYTLRESEVPVGDATLRVVHVADVNALVDAMGPDDFGPDERLPYWTVLWDAARDLAAWWGARAAEGLDVIELGAGLGLGSLAAARRGARVTTSDYEPHALAFAAENAARNGLTLDPLLLDWRAVEATCPERRGRYAVVFGADLVYEARNVAPLADAACFLRAPDGEIVVFDPGRPYFPSLEAALRARGLAVDVWTTPHGRALRAYTPGRLLGSDDR